MYDTSAALAPRRCVLSAVYAVVVVIVIMVVIAAPASCTVRVRFRVIIAGFRRGRLVELLGLVVDTANCTGQAVERP